MSWYRVDRDGVTIHVHAQPGAKRTEVAGLHGDCIKVRLASAPVDGKANACLVEFLAQRLGVKKSLLTITRGIASRRKAVFIAVAGLQPDALLAQEDDRG